MNIIEQSFEIKSCLKMLTNFIKIYTMLIMFYR